MSVKIIMHGCNGAMGQAITNIVSEDENAEIVAGIDLADNRENGYPVFTSIDACNIPADVVIDFASAKAADRLMDWCVEKELRLVLCSTGLSKEQLERVNETSRYTAVLRSANMSLGINMLLKLVKSVTEVLAPNGYDIEIVEKHHNQKLDAPSGTALALADSINEVMDGQYEYVYDRTMRRDKRGKKELGISAVRGGTIVGEHQIIFAGTDEVIEIKHEAFSKAVFAKGAVSAAKFLAGKPPGLYDMSDVIG